MELKQRSKKALRELKTEMQKQVNSLKLTYLKNFSIEDSIDEPYKEPKKFNHSNLNAKFNANFDANFKENQSKEDSLQTACFNDRAVSQTL